MKHSKSGLFLMELIVALLFFSLASTVCVHLFVKSSTLSDDTVALTYAVSQAQDLAEIYTACEGDIIQVHFLYPDSKILEDNVLTIEENGYRSTVIFFPEDEYGLIHGKIAVYDNSSRELYSLEIAHHIQERRDSHE